MIKGEFKNLVSPVIHTQMGRLNKGFVLIGMGKQNSKDLLSIISLPSSRAGSDFLATAPKSQQKRPPLT